MACPSGCTNGGGQIKSQPLVLVNALYAQSLQRGGGGSGGAGGARRERRERGQESEVQVGGVGVEEEVTSLRQVLHTLQHSGVGPSGHNADGQGRAEGKSKGEGGETINRSLRSFFWREGRGECFTPPCAGPTV